MTDTVKIADFIAEHRITMASNRVASNPHMADSEHMDHWKVVFTRQLPSTPGSRIQARKMTTYFSMGYGHHGAAPETKDVLDCLASDAASVDGQGFHGWADDFGYDHDSRKAEKTYKACVHRAKRLEQFLGSDLFHTLLYSTERE